MASFKFRQATGRVIYTIFCAALALLMWACAAASRPPDPNKPRANEPPYPIIFSASEETRQKSLASWAALTHAQGIENAPAPELQPATATISALPAAAALSLQIPKVETGQTGKEASEEETRESLRRFIANASSLLGIDPRDVSLIERADKNDQKIARYRQAPFAYPLRAGYGMLEITFTPDRRVLQLSSTAIPDTERINRALTALRDRLTAEQAAARLQGRGFSYQESTGKEATYTVAAPDEIRVRELVIYPIKRANDPSSLELHLAWEIAVRPSAPLLVYMDAVTGEIIAAAQAPST